MLFWGDGVAKDGGWFSGVPPQRNCPIIIQCSELKKKGKAQKCAQLKKTYICRKNTFDISPKIRQKKLGWMNSIAVFGQAFKSMDVSQDLDGLGPLKR